MPASLANPHHWYSMFFVFMFSCLRDRKDIKEPWDPKHVYGVCVGVIIFVSALFLAWRKLTAGSCGVLKVLCVLCMCIFFFFFLVPVFIGLWAFASRNMRVSLLRVFACMLVCLCVCPGELVMHACHPLHASLCTTELHMTSIWEQWDSDLITNSLLLIKTCRLHPPPSPFLFFSALSLASLSFARLSPSSPASSTPLLQSRTILRFLRCSLPKRAPFRALQKVISSPLFSFSVFIPSFLCSVLSSVHLSAIFIGCLQ